MVAEDTFKNKERLELDWDESEHHRLVVALRDQHLGLANAAAVLALNGLASPKNQVRIDEPQGVICLLLVKAAQNVRACGRFGRRTA